MKSLLNNLTTVSAIGLLCFALQACDANDGPMESAGEQVDKAATDMENAVEDACEEAKEGMKAEDTDC
ncbi:MAG: hypothetical protein IPM37_16430 [Hahellaceae bacterium]|nr:hypothetical protein [Hahellaceae bacterium]